MREYQQSVSSYGQACNATFDLVGHLLSETVFESEDGIIVKAGRNSFYYDPDSGIQPGEFVSLKIMDAEISSTVRGTTLALNGLIKSESLAKSHTFSLFYFMEWANGERLGFAARSSEMINRRIPLYLFEPSDFLYDSLFQISICRINTHGDFRRVGVGKGFLALVHENR